MALRETQAAVIGGWAVLMRVNERRYAERVADCAPLDELQEIEREVEEARAAMVAAADKVADEIMGGSHGAA